MNKKLDKDAKDDAMNKEDTGETDQKKLQKRMENLKEKFDDDEID